jgi:seryl-tRNA synthetase
MHDIRAIRANAPAFDAALARRGLPSVSPELLAPDAERRAARTATREKQTRRNTLSRKNRCRQALRWSGHGTSSR